MDMDYNQFFRHVGEYDCDPIYSFPTQLPSDQESCFRISFDIRKRSSLLILVPDLFIQERGANKHSRTSRKRTARSSNSLKLWRKLTQNSQTQEKSQCSDSGSFNRKKKFKKRRKPITKSIRSNLLVQRLSFRLMAHEDPKFSHYGNSASRDCIPSMLDLGEPIETQTDEEGRPEASSEAMLHALQKKYIKDPVEIHHIKQREGELTEAFMDRFKAESLHVKRAPKCLRISRFMHDITNPDIIKRLNDNISKFMDEMMSATTAFLRGVMDVANQSRKKGPPSWKHHKAASKLSFEKKPDFKGWQRSGRRHDKFTPLIKKVKEIMATNTVMIKAPLPMSSSAENRNRNKFCEFHGDKGHNTNECI
ncbi:hypothetical protein Tco_1303789 [Tanacetum coccineum]